LFSHYPASPSWPLSRSSASTICARASPNGVGETAAPLELNLSSALGAMRQCSLPPIAGSNLLLRSRPHHCCIVHLLVVLLRAAPLETPHLLPRPAVSEVSPGHVLP
jgi:hypothetical protein